MNWYKISQVSEAKSIDSKPIWQMTRDEFAGPMPEVKGDDYTEYDEWRRRVRRYDNEIHKAIAEGHISPDTVKSKGSILETSKANLKPLPSVLYHTTTAKDRVISEGLKTRDELSMSLGAGLGGGTSQAISFTTDLDIAINIKRAILEAREVSSGRMTIAQMLEAAKKGDGAKKPWLGEVLDYYRRYDSEADKERIGSNGIPMQIQLLMKGETKEFFILLGNEEKAKKLKEEGWYNNPEDKSEFVFRRRLTNEEIRDRTFDFFKVWSRYREHAGGFEDPLFFTSDITGLSSIPLDQVAVLEFRARPGAIGYQEQALGEWRTWSGRAVEFVRVVA